MTLRAPFPYFGGKSRIARVVWQHFGPVVNYVEPFAGSLAVLLARPCPFTGSETINDADGFVANFWRAVAHDGEAVAQWADWPVNENDLHARHVWLVGRAKTLRARLEGDPDYFDAKIAGWWGWGMSVWIGSGFCAGNGPWQQIDGQLVHVGTAGMGVRRQRVHVGNAGMGVHRKRVHVGDAGMGVHRQREALTDTFAALQDRLRDVRVCSGDWSRVCGPSVTVKHGITAVLLDPPYGDDRHVGLYRVDSSTVQQDVWAWAIEHGNDPLLRIAVCGYDDGREVPAGWTAHAWKTKGGYGSQGNGTGRDNASREVVWFSPHCLTRDRVAPLFAAHHPTDDETEDEVLS